MGRVKEKGVVSEVVAAAATKRKGTLEQAKPRRGRRERYLRRRRGKGTHTDTSEQHTVIDARGLQSL